MTTSPPVVSTPAAIGLVARARTRLFGERDPVATQLRDIARQGSGMASLAHASAFLLLVLFSLGSLIALGRDPLSRILAAYQAGQHLDIPDAVSLAVIALLVLCMDMAMLYAASKVRVLAARRAETKERGLHIAVMIVACALEAATYIYMSWIYEHPAWWLAWAIIAGRAAAAPLFAVYLSLSRPLPVGVDDILYQVELAAGAGVIRDAVTIANNPHAPLDKKVLLYAAAARLTGEQHARLMNLADALGAHALASGTIVDALPAPSRPPTGPGTPTVSGREGEREDGDYTTNMSLPAVHIVRPDQSSQRNQRLRAQQSGHGRGPGDSQVSGRSSTRNSKSGRGRTQRRAVEPAGPRIVAAIESNPALVRSATAGPRVRATAQVAGTAPSTVSRHAHSNPVVAQAVQRAVQ